MASATFKPSYTYISGNWSKYGCETLHEGLADISTTKRAYTVDMTDNPMVVKLTGPENPWYCASIEFRTKVLFDSTGYSSLDVVLDISSPGGDFEDGGFIDKEDYTSWKYLSDSIYTSVLNASNISNTYVKLYAYDGLVNIIWVAYAYIYVGDWYAAGDTGTLINAPTCTVTDSATGTIRVSWTALIHMLNFRVYETTQGNYVSSGTTDEYADDTGLNSGIYTYKVSTQSSQLGSYSGWGTTANCTLVRDMSKPTIKTTTYSSPFGTGIIQFDGSTNTGVDGYYYQLNSGDWSQGTTSTVVTWGSNTPLNSGSYTCQVMGYIGNTKGDSSLASTSYDIVRNMAAPESSDDGDINTDGSYTISWAENLIVDNYLLKENGFYLTEIDREVAYGSEQYNATGRTTDKYTYSISGQVNSTTNFSSTITQYVVRTPTNIGNNTSNISETGTFTISWDAVTNATKYQVYNGTQTVGDPVTAGTEELQISAQPSGVNTYYVTAILVDDDVDETEYEGEKSTGTTVTVIYPPTSVGANWNKSNIDNGELICIWTSPTPMDNCQVKVNLARDGVYDGWINAASASGHTFSNLSNRVEYKYIVKNTCGAVDGTEYGPCNETEVAIGWQGEVSGIGNPHTVCGRSDVSINKVSNVDDDNEINNDGS